MKIDNLNNMKKGWFIGDFEPSILKTNNVEVAVKHYLKDEEESAHYHKVSKEITLVVKGKVKFNDLLLCEGEMILIEPNEIVKFSAIEDSTTVVVKLPSTENDKFIIKEH